MRSLRAVVLSVALGAPAQAQEGTTGDLLAIAKAAYPGELCRWDQDDASGETRSWTLAFRYEYDGESDPVRALVLHRLPCFRGAYNVGSLWFTETEFEGLVPLHFAVPEFDVVFADDEEASVKDITVTGFTAEAALVNAEFDEEMQTIVSYSKWRGLGDASSSGTWSFRRGKFVLTRYEVDPTFNGEPDPITIFGDGP